MRICSVCNKVDANFFYWDSSYSNTIYFYNHEKIYWYNQKDTNGQFKPICSKCLKLKFGIFRLQGKQCKLVVYQQDFGKYNDYFRSLEEFVLLQ